MLTKIWDILKQILLLSYSHILTSLYCIVLRNYLKCVNDYLNMLNGIHAIFFMQTPMLKGDVQHKSLF